MWLRNYQKTTISSYIDRLHFHALNYYVQRETDTCIQHVFEFKESLLLP